MGKLVNMEGKEIESQEEKLKKDEFYKDMISHKVANLVVECKCGNVQVIGRDIETGGVQLTLPATNKHQIRMECPECGSWLSMHFIGVAYQEGEKPTLLVEDESEIEENLSMEENESIPEESK
jgi:hypothetical protein